jgi:hypothetical protein
MNSPGKYSAIVPSHIVPITMTHPPEYSSSSPSTSGDKDGCDSSSQPPGETIPPDTVGRNTKSVGRQLIPMKRTRSPGDEERGTPSQRQQFAANGSLKRRQWTSSASIAQDKSAWSLEEDWRLITMRRSRLRWDVISTAFPDRTAAECAWRYRSVGESACYSEDLLDEVALWYQE